MEGWAVGPGGEDRPTWDYEPRAITTCLLNSGFVLPIAFYIRDVHIEGDVLMIIMIKMNECLNVNMTLHNHAIYINYMLHMTHCLHDLQNISLPHMDQELTVIYHATLYI